MQNEPAEKTKIFLDDVKIYGTKINKDDDKEIFAWYGIPYAQPPVGNLRWKAPRDFNFESANFNATDFQKGVFKFRISMMN